MYNNRKNDRAIDRGKQKVGMVKVENNICSFQAELTRCKFVKS